MRLRVLAPLFWILVSTVFGLVRAFATPPRPAIPATKFDVTTYGAVGDGTTDNTTAIQSALTAAKNAGGGTVEIPAAAQPYRCGPITLSANTNLQVDAGATLQALPYGTYPNSNTSPAHFITVTSGATNVEISGGGTIDGNGSAWWTAYNNGTISNRPRLIQFNRGDTYLLTGVTLINSPMFHVAFNNSNNVTFDSVTITAPANSPNTDAIDPAGQHYLIRNCTISVGDDNIAVKAGSTFCGDIVVTNCAFGSGHGVSIGGQTNLGLDGMTIDHCTFNGTTTALRMKADPTQGGPVQNVTYSNLTLTNVPYPFAFYSYYRDIGTPGNTGSSRVTPAKAGSWNAAPPDALVSTTIPTWKNITLSNITATGATGYSIIWGLPLANALVANVTLDNVQISGTYGFELYNATNVQFTGGTTFTVPSGTPAVTTYNALAITSQPQSQSVAGGGTATFTVTTAGASGINNGGPTCQWLFNGTAVTDGTRVDGAVVSGSSSATLTISNAQAAEAGSYSVKVSNALDTWDAAVTKLVASNTPVSATSSVAQLTVGGVAASTLGNVSVRCSAGTGDQTLIAGFVIVGGGKQVLVRAIGPALASYGVTGVLPDPQLALYTSSNTILQSNDNWGSAATSPAIVTTEAKVGAFALPDNSLDSALLVPLADGGYTAQVSGKAATGVALAEIYDAATGVGGQLTNVSVRAVAGTGDNTLIVGFSISGSARKTVLIRAIGPTLAKYNVTATLADPQLAVFKLGEKTSLATNDNWDSSLSSTFTSVGAFSLPAGSKDSALLLTLDPGAYTAQVSGVGGGTGVALVEVYEVP